ncbi:MAG: GerMN domain-containing protein [Spirochaetales bacterium]|nr:GerMN domain-containing protein [Spirochaetales bacterium]
MTRRNKNKSSIGCLFWVALILLILVIFLFNRETIQDVLDETGFIEFIQSNKIEPEVERVDLQKETETTPDVESIDIVEQTAADQPETPPEPVKNTNENIIALEVTLENVETAAPVETPERPQKIRRSKLFFIVVDDNGGISLKEKVRPVYYVDSPLTETINALLDGLSGSELNLGLISLIPEQTKLLSVAVKDGTAYLNFSDGFRFNSFGIEGYNAQLKQIVYTTTEFANINSVQILIEGAVNDYMGSEGVFIGKPLTRADF